MNKLHGNGNAMWATHVCNKKVALDIGANIGGYAQSMLGNGVEEVHCFEPVPDQFVFLKENLGKDKRAILNNVAVSNKVGKMSDVTVHVAWTLGKTEDLDMSVCPDYVGKPTFDMDLIIIDDYCKDIKVDFMKIDVDGYEFRVLKGAERTILRDRPPIYIEFNGYLQSIAWKIL